MLSLLVTSALALAVNVQPVRADVGTIYIKADGSIEPPAAPLSTADNTTYTLTDNITSNADGIVIERDNVTLDGAGYTVTGSGSGNGTTLTDRSNVTIKNMTITNFGFGIWLSSSSNNTLSDNDVMTNEGTGIWLNSSSNNSMSGNNLTANSYYGIWLISSSNNTITGNDMTNNIDGILLWSSSNNNSISENNLASNYYGIDIDSSSNNGISENNIANDYYGIWLESSPGNSISENNITANNVDGMWVDYSSDNGISGNNVTANGDCGIWVDSSSGNGISENVITNNSVGISLDSSSSNSISGNSIANNSYGVWLYYFYSSSGNNSISGNNITANNVMGVYLESSSGNSVSGNTFTDDGLLVQNAFQNSVENNTVNGKPLVYLEGAANYSVVDDAGQVILVRCDSVRVENLNLSSASVGVQLLETNNSIISGNNIGANGAYGIWLYSSFNNTVSGNNITNNFYGIYFAFSTGNKVYNNYINNQFQVSSYQSTDVWDNGYPSGGNYWSDYDGTDLYSGPHQNQSASDGIGDTPYVIDADNLDNYPLMNPWSPPDIAVTDLTSAKTVIGQGYTGTVNVTFENLGNKIETFNATVYANSTSIQSEQIMLAMTNCTLSFTWNTTGFTTGNYTISAYATPLQGETSTANNNLTGGMVYVGIPGDINGDETVNKLDATALGDAFLATVGNSNWNPNADINGDNAINILDAIILGNHFLQHYP
jgi:parallel beta-helix repeat protein